MADEASTSTADESTTTRDTTTAEQKPDKSATDDLGDAGKKALDSERRERRAAEKRTSELEARLKEFEDRDKSEAERLAERAEAAEKRAAEIESRAMRLEVAHEKGLTPGQAKRLVGSTRDELEADADEILRDFPTKPGRPRGDVDQGARTTTKAEPGPGLERLRGAYANTTK